MPQQALKVILFLLRKIRSLPPGNYVVRITLQFFVCSHAQLSHKPRDCYVVLFKEMAPGDEDKASATDAVYVPLC